MLINIDRRRLAGGTHHADAVGTFGDVPVHQLAQSGIVNAAVFMQRGGQGNDAAGDLFHVKRTLTLQAGWRRNERHVPEGILLRQRQGKALPLAQASRC